jgi:hypothetical protein
MYIGNIVTNDNKTHQNFNVVDSLDKIIEGLPTLIIGLDIVYTINPNPDFFNRKLSDNIYWTFLVNQKRDLHNEDIYYFKEYCYKYLIKHIKYRYIDFIIDSDETITNIFKYIKNSEKKVGYKIDSMVYIYTKNYIFGINLDVIKYVGRDVNKLLKYLKSFINDFLFDNEILIEYKDYLDMLDNSIMYIPYIHSIKNE